MYVLQLTHGSRSPRVTAVAAMAPEPLRANLAVLLPAAFVPETLPCCCDAFACSTPTPAPLMFPSASGVGETDGEGPLDSASEMALAEELPGMVTGMLGLPLPSPAPPMDVAKLADVAVDADEDFRLRPLGLGAGCAPDDAVDVDVGAEPAGVCAREDAAEGAAESWGPGLN